MNHNNYIDRINRVLTFIEENSSQPIKLEELASLSNFSKYHFSRIFTSVVGISPMSYVKQKRLQKSIYFLIHTDKTITEISSICGFESVSNLNFLFKKHFDKRPSKVRKDSRKLSNFSLQISKMQEDLSKIREYDKRNKSDFVRRMWDMNVLIKELPEYEVAYMRRVGSYFETNDLWIQLGDWAEKYGLRPPEQLFIGISLDDPNIVDEYACRYDACVTIPKGFDQEEQTDVQFKKLPGGLYALYYFYDTVDKLAFIYQSLFGQWLPNSEYDPDDRPCLEFCMNNPFHDPEGKAKIDLYIPIRKRK